MQRDRVLLAEMIDAAERAISLVAGQTVLVKLDDARLEPLNQAGRS